MNIGTLSAEAGADDEVGVECDDDDDDDVPADDAGPTPLRSASRDSWTKAVTCIGGKCETNGTWV